jgi:hypothetical protein
MPTAGAEVTAEYAYFSINGLLIVCLFDKQQYYEPACHSISYNAAFFRFHETQPLEQSWDRSAFNVN